MKTLSLTLNPIGTTLIVTEFSVSFPDFLVVYGSYQHLLILLHSM